VSIRGALRARIPAQATPAWADASRAMPNRPALRETVGCTVSRHGQSRVFPSANGEHRSSAAPPTAWEKSARLGCALTRPLCLPTKSSP